MKKVLFTLAAIAAAASVHASYLYWQIDGSEPALTGEGLTAGVDYTGVRIFASNNNGDTKTYLNLGYADFDSDSFQPLGYAVSAPVGGMLLADVSDFSSGGYSFYVELINGDVSNWSGVDKVNVSAYQTSSFAGQLVSSGNSDPITYTGLESKGFIGTDLSPVSMAVWHGGGSYSPVPEPTSAMLVLIGLAGLALKRRAV